MKLKDKKTNKSEVLIDKTLNSFCVTQSKLGKDGIDCTQWFADFDFYKRFEIVKYSKIKWI
jgi:hypothetical protein